MNDRNLNPAYHEALASARGISTTAPRAVGEFQGFIDGEPAVRWIDRKNMPNVGDKLFLDPARAAGIEPRMWSILLTSANHGVVGPLGHPFKHAGEHHERMVVVEVPAAAGAPIDQVNLRLATGTDRQADVDRALKAALAWANEEYVCARNLGKGGPGTHEACDAKKAECIAAISALGTPVAAQAGQVAPVADMTKEQIVHRAIVELRVFAPHELRQDGQVAVPEGFALVHEDATNEMISAIEREVESQLDASGIARSDMCRLDGEHIFDALFDALPAVAQQAPADWISVDERLPEGRYCLATYRDRAGKLRIIRAMYVRQYEVKASGEECDGQSTEYNETDDTEYLKAGWLECIDNWGEYSNVYVCEGEVTHWMPLPPLPGAQASTAGERPEQQS